MQSHGGKDETMHSARRARALARQLHVPRTNTYSPGNVYSVADVHPVSDIYACFSSYLSVCRTPNEYCHAENCIFIAGNFVCCELHCVERCCRAYERNDVRARHSF